MAINAQEAQIEKIHDLPQDEPIVLLNLLRFAEGGTGEPQFKKYVNHCLQHTPRFGAEVVYIGRSALVLAAEEGQSWDAVWLVRYPNPRAWFALFRDEAFRAGFHLRGASLTEAVLQVTTPWDVTAD